MIYAHITLVLLAVLATRVHAQTMSPRDITVVATSSTSLVRKNHKLEFVEPARTYNLNDRSELNDFTRFLRASAPLGDLEATLLSFMGEYISEQNDALKKLIEEYRASDLQIRLTLNRSPRPKLIGKSRHSCNIEITLKSERLGELVKTLNTKLDQLKALNQEIENFQDEVTSTIRGSYDPAATKNPTSTKYFDLCMGAMFDMSLDYFRYSALERAIVDTRKKIESAERTYRRRIRAINKKIAEVES